jgi:hypothetical protein
MSIFYECKGNLKKMNVIQCPDITYLSVLFKLYRMYSKYNKKRPSNVYQDVVFIDMKQDGTSVSSQYFGTAIVY